MIASSHARRRRSALSVGASLVLLAASGMAQEVRRAIPVEIPTAPAVPLNAFDQPSPTPAPGATPPTIIDENGPRAPAPVPDTAVSSASADQMQFQYANDFFARKVYDLAAPEYEKYLNLYPHADAPDREAAMFRLGECYRNLGNTNAAKNAYQSLLVDFATGEFIGPAAYRLADLCYADKDYDGALNYYRKASVRVADPLVALSAKFYSARCLEALSLPLEARITYEDIVATPGNNPYRDPSRLALAEILNASGRPADALQQFEALAKDAQQPAVKAEAYVKAGLLNVDLGNPDKGADELNKALALPDIGALKPVAQIGLLRVLDTTGKYQQLLSQYQQAFDDLPADVKPEVLNLAADAKEQTGDSAGASELYQQVITNYPNTVYADEAKYRHLVSLYNADDPGLMAAVDQFLAGNPDPAKRNQVLLLKAEALFKDKKYADATKVYESLDVSVLPPTYRAESLYHLGWCYMQINEPDKAISTLTQFLNNYPLNKLVPTALAQRAIAYQQTKDLTSALKDFNELLEEYPKAPERELALKQKALIQGEQQDNAGMSQTFQQLLQEYPHSPAAAEANYWIGWAAFSAKDYKAALDPLEQARKLDKAEFFERATLRIIAAHYTLEDRDALAAEVDLYNNNQPKDKVPAEVLRWLGESYLSAKDCDNAVKYLSQLSLRPEATSDDWLSLGRAQLGALKYADAIDSITKYLDKVSDPQAMASGLLVTGRALIGLNKLDDAQATADKVCSLQPEGQLNAEGRMLSGDIQVARGDFDAAAKIFLSISVIIDDPQITPAAMEKAYDCLLKTGDKAQAAKVLNDLQTKYPEYKVSDSGLAGQ